MRRKFTLLCLMIAAMASSISTQAFTVYYNNPNNWATVKAYMYKGSTNNEWPGAAMTKEGSLYKITVDAAYADGNIIFNDGNGNQYPAATGLKMANADMICWQDKDDDSKTLWTDYNANPFKVYFDNSTANWSTPYIYYFGAETSQTWPGTALTNPVNNVYEFTCPAGTAGVIFSNNGNNQTANLAAKPEHSYNQTGDMGAVEEVGEPFTVYFDNSSTNWATPKCHYFGGSEASEWPGVNMQVEQGKIYKLTVPAGTTGLVFNDGNGSQSDDLEAVAGHVYTKTGDQGVYTPGAGPSVETPAALYILGTVGDTFWATTPGIALTKSGNTFTATGVEIKPSKAGDEYGYFTLVSAVGANWDVVNGSNRYGAATEDAELTSGVAADVTLYEKNVNASSAKSWKVEAGTYTVAVDFATMKITATRTDQAIEAGNGSLAVPALTIQPGKDATMEIQITTDQNMTALQLDIELPEVVEAGQPLISRAMANHTLSSSVVNGKLRIVVFSENNSTFNSQNGTLLYLPLTAKANAAVGEYDITLSNIVFSDGNLKAVKPANVTAKLTVEAVGTGSVTLDKTVLALNPGAEAQLTATVLPEDAAVKTVTWSTDKPAVATVDQTGKVTAVANGTAVITAACNGLTATCTVYVGKKSQTITWTQDFNNVGVGDEITFNATASSGADVEYVITNGSALATLSGNKLTATAAGVVTVEARQAGNTEYAPAEPVSKTITIWLGYYEGDANGDDVIDLQDATSTVNHILGNTPADFNVNAADMNGDGVIDVVDVTLIVEKILAQTPQPAPNRFKAEGQSDKEQFNVKADDYSLRIVFSNMENYTATQFDITLPEGIEVQNGVMAGGTNHIVAFRNYDNGMTRVVVMSMKNDNFARNGYISLYLNDKCNGMVKLENALLNRVDGNNIIQTEAAGFQGVTTGLENIGVDGDTDCTVYTIDGICVYRGSLNGFSALGRTGLFVIRTADKVAKVIVK